MTCCRMRHVGLLVPGLATAVFAVLAILLPVGSDGLGAGLTTECGTAPALARWARDIHDGFWKTGNVAHPCGVVDDSELAQARRLLLMERSDEALAIYQRLSLADDADREAVFRAFELMVVDGDYARAERFARAADGLLGSGVLRNNLAWHLVQTSQTPDKALALALESVATGRTTYNVDTLAWAYWRVGDVAKATQTARETATIAPSGFGDLDEWEDAEARASSQRLLSLMELERGR